MTSASRWLTRLGLLALPAGLLGCPPSPPQEPVRVVARPAQTVASWPTVVADGAAGSVPLPWPARPRAEVELWQVDLLDLDQPELPAWLEAWKERPGQLARRLPVAASAAREGKIALSGPGAYIIRSRAGAEANVALALASRLRLAFLLEDSDFEVLCADARTGQPVQGAFVKVVYRAERLGREQVLAASGTTDATGRWHSSLVRDRFAPSLAAAAVAVHNNHYAVATARRALDHSDADYRLTLRARRPVFRPGRPAEVTGVLQRRVSPTGFSPVGNAAVRLWLLGPKSNAASTVQARTSAVGAFTESVPIPADATPGTYRVVATLEERPEAEPWRLELFRVEAPEPQPFRLEMAADRSVVAPGEALRVELAATRADGQPMAGAGVRLLSWGYPVSLSGVPPWVRGTEPIDADRVDVLPAGFPVVAETDAQGKLALEWKPSRAELPCTDLLCALRAEVRAQDGSRASRTVEFILLGRPPPLALDASRSFRQPSEPFELRLTSPLPAEERAAVPAACTLAFEDTGGRRRTFQLVTGPVSALAGRRLVVTATRPGRYAFAARAGDDASEAVVWVVAGRAHLGWREAKRPVLVVERPWCRRGEALAAVIAAPGRGAPVALTLRSGGAIERHTVPLRTGARGLALAIQRAHTDPVEAALVQVHNGAVHVGRATIGVEPGGRALGVVARLMWVRKGEWSGRGYGITVQDRMGDRVHSIVHIELVRPAFQGTPPVAIQRHTLHWHGGSATNVRGEREVGIQEPLLADSYGLFIEALAPDGRGGSTLLATHPAGSVLPEAGEPRPPREKLVALARHGLDAPLARWLVVRLLERHPRLQAEVPRLVADAPSDDEAIAALRLAAGYPAAAAAALEAALARGESIRPAALAAAADFASEVRPALQRVLASDPDPAAREAAAQALARALPLALAALVQALSSDSDPLVRAAAAVALGNGDETAVRALAEAAPEETHPEVRLAIVEALRRLGGGAAAEALLDLVTAEGLEVTVAALRALTEVGYRGMDPRLLRLLRRGKRLARTEAARLLAQAGTAQAARAILAEASERPTGPLVEALSAVRSRSVDAAMARWLSDDDPAVRLAAAEHLAALDDSRARPVLRDFLDPASPPGLADRAARALIEQRDDAAVPRLVPALEAGRLSPATRRAFVQAAGRLGWQQAAPALVGMVARGLSEPDRLDDPDQRRLWLDAVDAVARVGPIWDAVVERAVPDVAPGSPYAPALAALRADGLAGMLRSLWRSPLPDDLRRATIEPYARLQGTAAVPDLVGLLESPVLQGAAARALVTLEATDPLLAALRRPSPRARSAAAAALGAIGDTRAAPALEALLDDPDAFVRLEAAWALARVTKRPVVYTDHLGEPRQATP